MSKRRTLLIPGVVLGVALVLGVVLFIGVLIGLGFLLHRMLAPSPFTLDPPFRPDPPIRPDRPIIPDPPYIPDLTWPYMRDLDGSATEVMRCKSCAFVTPSGQVLGKGAGEEIDGAECVIRMNDAPTAGYEHDVGKRTTLRVLGFHAVKPFVERNSAELLEEGRVPVNMVLGQPDRIDAMDPWIQSFCGAKRSNCFRITHHTEQTKFNTLYQKETGLENVGSKTWLSTGFFTMAMAVKDGVCEDLTVYGMVPPRHCETAPDANSTLYHYYDASHGYECDYYIEHEAGKPEGNHRLIEKEVYGRWAQTYNITFAHPAWPEILKK